MYFLGTDLVEIQRIEKSIQNEGFIKKVYGENEQIELEQKNYRAQSAAALFAAKEAFSKALGTGIRGFLLSEVEVLHNELGAPYFKLSGNALKIAQQRNLQFSLSLSHTKTLAQAVVIAFEQKSN